MKGLSGKFFPFDWCDGKKLSARVQCSPPEILLALWMRMCKKAHCQGGGGGTLNCYFMAVSRTPQGGVGEAETLLFNDCEFVS